MKPKTKIRYLLAFMAIMLITIASCQNIHKSPDGAVVAFIVAAEQRDMTKAWNILSPELQAYYNGLGEKMRKSGRGALENEIARITKFRTVKKDYTINVDGANGSIINLVTVGGPTHKVETMDVGGDFKIKDEASMKNLLDAITAESTKDKGY